jgi:hypothetical protein
MSIKTNPEYIEDYLDEDPVILNQQFAVLSYILPSDNNEFTFPLFKIRGSYKTIEEAQRRIEKLKNTEKFFHMFIVEVGKWGQLFTDEELEKIGDELETVYRDQQLNNLMKSYKENKEHSDVVFSERKDNLKKRAEFEASEEGKKYLENLKESPVTVKARIEFQEKEILKVQKQLETLKELKEKDQETLKTFTEEELKELDIDSEGNLKINPMLEAQSLPEIKTSFSDPTNTHKNKESRLIKELKENFDSIEFNKLFEKKYGTQFSEVANSVGFTGSSS